MTNHPHAVCRRNFRWFSLPAVLVFSMAALTLPSACVTVNVNLPESAVQKASDDYVKELYKSKEKGKTSAPVAAPTSAPHAAQFGFIPLAEAAEESMLRTDSPKVNEIKERQIQRLDEVTTAKKSGVMGESNEGYLVIKGARSMKAEKLVLDENSDRKDLYGEILKHNSISKGKMFDIQKGFARSFQEVSPPGTWVQDESGKWSRK